MKAYPAIVFCVLLWALMVGCARTTSPTNGELWTREQIDEPDGKFDSHFGGSLALSGDGGTLVVEGGGVPRESRKVYVYSRSKGVWMWQDDLDWSSSSFKWHSDLDSLSLSADGSMLVLGTDGREAGSNRLAGKVYVCASHGDAWNWKRQKELDGPGRTGVDVFDGEVTLSGDGATLAAGGAAGTGAGGHQVFGKVYLYVRSGDSWEQQTELGLDDSHRFLAVSDNGTTLIIGAYQASVGGHQDAGKVFVYVRHGDAWQQQMELDDPDGGSKDHFGALVALSGDGSTLVVGAERASVAGDLVLGKVYVYARHGDAWQQQAILDGPEGTDIDMFGGSLALSGDGTTLAVGAKSSSVGHHEYAGNVYVYVRRGETWKQQTKLSDPDGGPEDQFGFPVAISRDGTTLAVGASGAESGHHNNVGKVFVYQFRPRTDSN